MLEAIMLCVLWLGVGDLAMLRVNFLIDAEQQWKELALWKKIPMLLVAPILYIIVRFVKAIAK